MVPSPTYLLRETYREGGKVKHRTIRNITSLGIENIARIALIFKGVDLVPDQVAIAIVHSRLHGHIEAILTAILQISLDTMISREPNIAFNNLTGGVVIWVVLLGSWTVI